MLQATLVDINGELHTTSCPDCQDKDREIRTLEANVDALQDELTEKARKIRALKKAIERDRRSDASRQQVEEIVEDWKKQTGKRRCILTAQAHDRITARLNEGYTVDHFKLANVACAHDPWPTSKRYPDPQDDIRTIAQNGQHLEDYANRGARWLNRLSYAHELVPVPFIKRTRPLLVAMHKLLEAGLSAVVDEELGRGAAICPVCTRQMKFREDGEGVWFECPHGCKHEAISAAVKLILNPPAIATVQNFPNPLANGTA